MCQLIAVFVFRAELGQGGPGSFAPAGDLRRREPPAAADHRATVGQRLLGIVDS
jgi:hypothetical protein